MNTCGMTDEVLAQYTREILTRRGWQSRAGLGQDEPPCLVQAAGEALTVLREYSLFEGNIARLFERLDGFAQALGFRNRYEAARWNDAQTSIEAILGRLETVA